MTKLNLGERPRILIIRRDNIGDLVCTTPAFAALRKRYPSAEIAALVNTYNKDVLFGHPDVDKVFSYQKFKHSGRLSGRLTASIRRIAIIVKIRCWGPDVAILAKSSYDRHGLQFARQIGAKLVIGYAPTRQDRMLPLPDICLETPEFGQLHEVEAVHELLAPLGVKNPPGPLQVFPSTAIVAQLNRQIPQAEFRIAVHISAREPERRWGTENFIKLAHHILATMPNIQVLLFWSPGNSDDPCHPGDDVAASVILETVRNDRLIPIRTENLSMLIAGLSICDIFFGADGGAIHVAAGLSMKTLALFENIDDKKMHWYPWKTESILVCSSKKNNPNISAIEIPQVMAGLEKLLDEFRCGRKSR